MVWRNRRRRRRVANVKVVNVEDCQCGAVQVQWRVRSVELEVPEGVRSRFDEPPPLVQAVISLFAVPHSRISAMSIDNLIDVM